MWKELESYFQRSWSSGLKAEANKTKFFLRKLQFQGRIVSEQAN